MGNPLAGSRRLSFPIASADGTASEAPSASSEGPAVEVCENVDSARDPLQPPLYVREARISGHQKNRSPAFAGDRFSRALLSFSGCCQL